MVPYAGYAYIGAPSVSNGPDGMWWMETFLPLVTDIPISMLGFHWYDAWWNQACESNSVLFSIPDVSIKHTDH